MDQDEKLFKAIEEQYRELRDKRAHAQYVITRLTVFYGLMIGWEVTQQDARLSLPVKGFVTAITIMISVALCISLYHIHRAYKTIATVIVKMSTQLGFFKDGCYIEGESIYPKTWQSFGRPVFSQAWWTVYPIVIGGIAAVLLWLPK